VSALTPAEIFDLRGRTALVTGASSGLGVDLARTLRAAGATVFVAARRRDRLEALVAEDAGFRPIQCDVSDQASVDAAVTEIHSQIPTLDILVNNAGTTIPARAEDERIEDFRYVLDVNLVGAFHLSQLVGRRMLEAGGGSIVNVASILGMVASSPNRQAAYCASKGALLNLTRELAVQWAKRGVRVNAIAPGFFPSELTTELLEDGPGGEYVRANTPMSRPGRPGELRGTLLLLAGDAGSYITGEVIAVDGGWTAR
jgi:NAD(P)-dependent dehydrogenase (short-subunit alcohol dehydrogenase family)